MHLFDLGFLDCPELINNNWNKVGTLKIDCGVVMLYFLSTFISSHKLSDLTPITKTMPTIIKQVLFKALKHEQLLIGSPINVEQRIIQFVDHMIGFRQFLKIAKTTYTIIIVGCEYLRVLTDVLLAYIALYFICRVINILNIFIFTQKTLAALSFYSSMA